MKKTHFRGVYLGLTQSILLKQCFLYISRVYQEAHNYKIYALKARKKSRILFNVKKRNINRKTPLINSGSNQRKQKFESSQPKVSSVFYTGLFNIKSNNQSSIALFLCLCIMRTHVRHSLREKAKLLRRIQLYTATPIGS